jgi:hypothetical protein
MGHKVAKSSSTLYLIFVLQACTQTHTRTHKSSLIKSSAPCPTFMHTLFRHTRAKVLHCILQVTFIEAMDTLMPTFDPEIRRVADRVLIQPRKIDGYTSVFATEVCVCLYIRASVLAHPNFGGCILATGVYACFLWLCA